MPNKTLASLSALALGLGLANAHSVAFSENFNGDYAANFPSIIDMDHLPPLDNFRPLFTDGNGVARAWWRLRDSNASPDGFLGSHSAYRTPAASNDWVVSRAIEIPTEGYTLTFGAQSMQMRKEGDRISDLDVFISETPITESNLPTTPALHIDRVPEGDYPLDIENDFTEYSINLDRYAGKTIYIAFANLNYDKDILCIDNVLVQRLDQAELTASSPRYVEKGAFEVNADFAAVGATLKDWTLTFDPGTGAAKQTFDGADLADAERLQHTFSATIEADKTANWTVTLTAAGIQPIVAEGTVTGLSFVPYHRVLFEEATGAWCGNCPLGIYAIEQMITHPEMKDYVIPVSVHINGSPNDYMVDDNYSYMLGITSAPAYRVDRGLVVGYFSNQYDATPEIDLAETRSTAAQVRLRHLETALLDIDLDADFVTEGADTTAIAAKVTIRPAMTLPGSPYRIGFILAENNVSFDMPVFWSQHNYYANMQGFQSDMHGFCELPEEIDGWTYHDVARGVYDFHGLDEFTMPQTLEMDKDYSFETTIEIPDTYRELSGSSTLPVAPAVNPANLSLIAFILDSDDSFSAVNSIALPMTEQAEVRPGIRELADEWLRRNGIGEVESAPADATVEYYNLQGLRVADPAAGIYIVRRGNKVTKEYIR